MKKILYVTTIGTTINAFLVPHIKMLINEGNKVDCACSIDVPIDKELIDKNIKLYDIPFSRTPLDIKNIKAFIKLIKIQKNNNYDIVHVHTPVASVYGRLLKLVFPKIKTVYTAHGFHFYRGAPKYKWIVFYIIEKIMSIITDVLITMNKEDYYISKKKLYANKKYNVNGVGVDIYKYLNSKVDSLDIRKELDLTEEDIVITVIAELSNRKNQIQAIKSIEALSRKYNNIKLLLVGNGNQREALEEYIDKQNLGNSVKILGYRSDVPSILAITDIVGLFSYHEGLPRNLMEAMAVKKPIVCTDIRGNNDLVENGKNGFLVNINDIENTIEAIEKLYIHEELRISMGKSGFEKIQEYSTENILQQMKSIFNEILQTI